MSGAVPADPLATEVQRCLALAADEQAGDEFTRPLRSGSLAPMRQAEADLAAGRRLAALHRLAALRANLGGAAFVDGIAAQRRDQAGFEAEWQRVGGLLAKSDAPRAALAALHGAALRAEAEATLPQAALLHQASLEYARNTEPQYGLFYLGSALAANDFPALCASLETSEVRAAPPLRAIRAELDALQELLLAAYRPPLSVERHAEFIGASSALKEARALDAAGARHGALLRYLTAQARCAPLVDTAPAPSAEELGKLLDGFEPRIRGGATDHGIAQVFLEYARSEIAAAQGAAAPIAVAIARHALPAYFAALAAPAVAAEPRTADVDLTLVRWPFT